MQRRAPARGAADVSCTLPRRPDFADLSPLKQELEQLLRDSLAKLAGTVLPTTPPAADAVVLERTREAQHGDFATNVALRLAKSARRNPRELAEAIVAALPASPLLGRAEVAGAGFINFHLTAAAYARELASLHAQAGAYGESRLGRGGRVLVEFVSANPTGPLHVGHGRSEEHTSELQSPMYLVCRLLREKKKHPGPPRQPRPTVPASPPSLARRAGTRAAPAPAERASVTGPRRTRRPAARTVGRRVRMLP